MEDYIIIQNFRTLELKLKNLESNLNYGENRRLYNHYKNDLETIQDYIDTGIKLNSKYEWQYHKKSTKFFLDPPKKRGVQNLKKNVSDPKEIFNNVKRFTRHPSNKALQILMPKNRNWFI